MNELWGTKLLNGIEKFHFKRCLSFDDKSTRRVFDKLAHIREYYEDFVENCQKCYSLETEVTIDEMLLKFHVCYSFRQYIASGITDTKVFYCYNKELYVGQQLEGPYAAGSNKSADVVKRIAYPTKYSGRNIKADN